MTATLVFKLLRDIRLGLLVTVILLGGFQTTWAKVTERVDGHLLPSLNEGIPKGVKFIRKILFDGPGKIMQTLMGGETINFERPMDMLSIGYVHPLLQTILCIWAIARAAGAVAGEIDRGTMELLMAQPIPRSRLILAHFCVDLLTIPILCLSLWAGNWLGLSLSGLLQIGAPISTTELAIDPTLLWPCLLNVGALLFAVSGTTMWLSAAGRSRNRVMGVSFLLVLLQFTVNLVGQLWESVAPLRPFTVFYYFQPQRMLLTGHWSVELGNFWGKEVGLPAVPMLAVLGVVGLIGYLGALWAFCRRELPAPL